MVGYRNTENNTKEDIQLKNGKKINCIRLRMKTKEGAKIVQTGYKQVLKIIGVF